MASNSFNPLSLVTAPISGAFGLAGSKAQANAEQQASQLQHQSTEEALADARTQRQYQQGQYADYLGRLQPYMNLGNTAGSTLQAALAKSPYGVVAAGGQAPPPQQYTLPQSSIGTLATKP
jgi:hypothetical protein